MKQLLWRVVRRMFRRQLSADVSAVLSPAYELRLISSWTLHELDAALKSPSRPDRMRLLCAWGGSRVIRG